MTPDVPRFASPLPSLRHALDGLRRRVREALARRREAHDTSAGRRGDAGAPWSTEQVCAELRARLLDDDDGHTALAMRHLGVVHDTLAHGTWCALDALPGPVLARACLQAKMLLDDEPSPGLSVLVDRLRVAETGVRLRAEAMAAAPAARAPAASAPAAAPAARARKATTV